MKPRVVIHPGFVRSVTDGDVHYLTGYTLRRLYGLEHYANVVILSPTSMLGFRNQKGDIHLYPSGVGRYERPRETL